MCGIVGIISKEAHDVLSVLDMRDALTHRGPDAQGSFRSDDGRVGLGHTRLSIIDLSEAANQPFISADGRYAIVFNGEIYNYKDIREKLIHAGFVFRTNSDTEVIVCAFTFWGPSMVDKLDGMFALAIYDKIAHELFLFRDPMGKKPLYYYQSENCFAFASEIKALLRNAEIKSTRKIARQSLITFLHLGYVPEPYSAFESIFKFPSGHWGIVKPNGKLVLHSYFNLRESVPTPNICDPSQAITQLTSVLNSAVSKRLISDVPLGVFLSGGIDSSLVAAMATQHSGSPVKTFCIGFNEFEFDESENARLVAKHLKTEHFEFILREQDAVEHLDYYLSHFDDPFADTSAIPTMLLAKMTRDHVKVALTGDGGDELFLGYGSYTWANRLASPFWKATSTPLKTVFKYSGKNRFSRIAHMLDFSNEPNLRSHIFSQEQFFFSQQEIRNNLLRNKNQIVDFEYDESFLRNQNLSPAEKQAVFDLNYYLKDDLLVKVDRMSMYYGLECRSPFLDRDVVRLALQIDGRLKIRHGERKWILKQILSKYLPDHLVHKKKWGFSIPLAKWLKNELRYLFDKYLSEEAIEQVGLFNSAYVAKLKTRFFVDEESKFLYSRLWLIIVIQKWVIEKS